MSDNSVFNSIMTGLNEALEDAKSERPILKRHKVTVETVKIYEAAEVKKIRKSTVYHDFTKVTAKNVVAFFS
ncbi:hypothetical protein CIY_19290 [Butyrivibrio fibrisolvens 16/4]|nr:hypothetical protein CIY_19290 [Butyrivibrio fibrisolvens 16/4]